jgi:hypothetical protein
VHRYAAVDAAYLVTWNEKHLTYLMCGNTPEGQEFLSEFPQLQILPPPEFLRQVRQSIP